MICQVAQSSRHLHFATCCTMALKGGEDGNDWQLSTVCRRQSRPTPPRLRFLPRSRRGTQGTSLILQGWLRSGRRATHIVEHDKREDYLKRLAELGINVQEMMDTGRLDVRAVDRNVCARPPVRPGCHAGLGRRSNPIGRGCRVPDELDWWGIIWTGYLSISQPRTTCWNTRRASTTFFPSTTTPVICNYDLSKVNASVAMDIMRTHPLVIIGGLLRENPFFVPPDEFLFEIRERRLRGSQRTAN